MCFHHRRRTLGVVSYNTVDNLKCECVWFNSIYAFPSQIHGNMEHYKIVYIYIHTYTHTNIISC